MMSIPPFGNPWSYRFKGASVGNILSQHSEKKIKKQDFFQSEQNNFFFFSPDRHTTSLTSDKSLKFLMPENGKRGTSAM